MHSSGVTAANERLRLLTHVSDLTFAFAAASSWNSLMIVEEKSKAAPTHSGFRIPEIILLGRTSTYEVRSVYVRAAY